MRRLLLRSPAFARDLRAWLKSHPGTADALAAALEQLSADSAHPSLRTHKLRGALSLGNDGARLERCRVAADSQVARGAVRLLGVQRGLRFARGVRVCAAREGRSHPAAGSRNPRRSVLRNGSAITRVAEVVRLRSELSRVRLHHFWPKVSALARSVRRVLLTELLQRSVGEVAEH